MLVSQVQVDSHVRTVEPQWECLETVNATAKLDTQGQTANKLKHAKMVQTVNHA